MNIIALDLGFIEIYWYSIFILVGMLLGLFYVYRETRRLGIESDDTSEILFSLLIWGIIGARIYYVIFSLDYYLIHPIEIFEVWKGGLAIHGGMMAGLLYLSRYSHKHNYNLWKVTDILIPALLLGQIVGRWGNFFNGEAYGPVTTAKALSFLPSFIRNGMLIGGLYRTPLFLYESILNLIALITILIIRKRPLMRNGYITSFYLIYYGGVRLIIEPLRIDSLYLGKLRVAILTSIIMIISGLVLFSKSKKGRRLENLYNGDAEYEEEEYIETDV